MLYIQLPDSICPANVKKNKDGYYYFQARDETILLKDLAAFAKDGVYDVSLADGSRLMGTVTPKCPNEDRTYAAYQPGSHAPSQWCSFVNGIENNQSKTLTNKTHETSTDTYRLMNKSIRDEIGVAEDVSEVHASNKSPSA